MEPLLERNLWNFWNPLEPLEPSYGAALHVLHIVENVLLRYSPEVGFSVPDLQPSLETSARKTLDATITDDDRRTLTVVPVVQSCINIPQGIIEYAQSSAIDLIVIGTHGRGGIQHFLMGSVAERVVRSAPCPVLTVRSHERDLIAPDALVAGQDLGTPAPSM